MFTCLAGLSLLPVTGNAQLPLPAQWVYSPVQQVQSVAYSPDGSRLAVGGYGGVQIYSTSTNTLVCSLPTSATSGVFAVSFSQDGKTLAVGGQGIVDTKYSGIVEIWNVLSVSLKATFSTSATTIYAVAFSPDGKTLADAGDKSTLELWSVSNGSKAFSLATAATIQANSVAFSPDGKTLAVGGQASGNGLNTGVLEFWNTSTGSLMLRPTLAASFISSVGFSPSGTSVIIGGSSLDPTTHVDVGLLQLWSTATGRMTHTLTTSATTVSSVTFSPDGSKVADGGISDVSGVLETWSAASPNSAVSYLTSETGGVLGIAYSPNGMRITAGGISAQSTLSILENWSTSTTTPASVLNVAPYQGLSAVAFSGSGQTIVTAGSGIDSNGNQVGALNLWNATTGVPIATLNTAALPPATVAVSSDGVTLAVGGTGYSVTDNTVGILELWNIATQKLSASLATSSQSINSVAFSPTGNLLADGGISVDPSTSVQSGCVELWTLATKKSAQLSTTATTITTVAFSPDGNTLAVGGTFAGHIQHGVVELFDVATGKISISLATAIVQVSAESFSPDGAMLLIAGEASNGPIVEVWNNVTKKLITTFDLAALTGQVNSLAFNNDGKTLFVGTESGLAVYDTSTTQLLSFYNGGVLTNSGVQCFGISANGAEFAYGTTVGSLAASINPYVLSTANIAKLSLSSNSVLGGKNIIGTVFLATKAASGGVPVTLSSSDASAIIPSSVTVPEGASSATFAITTQGVNSSTTVTIKAGKGTTAKTATLVIEPPALTSLSLSPSAIGGGVNVTGNVSLSGPAAQGGTTIALLSNSVDASVPTQVVVPPGQASATFTIFTSVVTTQTLAKISATLGPKSQNAVLTISPSRLAMISISPSSVVGGTSTTGTVTLTGNAPAQGFVVALSSNSSSVLVPNSVTVEAGSDASSFTITTVAVSGDTTAVVSVKTGSTSKTASLMVKAPLVSALTLAPSAVKGGASSIGTVTIASPAPAGGLAVLVSSNLSSAAVPTTVKIPAGATSATFTIKTKSVSTKKIVTIKVKYGTSSQTADLSIS